ncbi:MAG: TRAP transporter substrate-binding protein [Pseudomonadota bacterium]
MKRRSKKARAIKRREFVTGLGAGAVAAGVAGCAPQGGSVECEGAGSGERLNWKMVTTWPANLPGLGTSATYLADKITKLSGGRLTVKVYAAGELVPAFEIFDAVSQGTAELGHGAGYYWTGKSEAAQFFTAVPFGMNSAEMNGWLYYGGGLDLWREVYAPFNLVPFPAGNTSVQTGGWFNREINTVEDLRGLKMRIPGLGGKVLRRAGGLPVSLPGGEIFTALQTGSIDATEWVGPANDLALGFHKAARYYYNPGWHEPGPVLECMVNKDAFEALPDDLQEIVATAAEATNNQMPADYMALNARALESLVNEHNVELRRFPSEVMDRLRELSQEVIDELVASDEMVARVYSSYSEFQERAAKWSAISDYAYYVARDSA